MATQLILTAVSADRPGVVEALAEVISRHGGNWVDSAMARLGGDFAGIVRVTVPDDQLTALEADLADLAKEGITVTWHPARSEAEAAGRPAELTVTGLDKQGIVFQVTRILARHGVNVDDLRTSVFTASMTGEPIFSAKARICLPASLDIGALRDALEDIASDIMVDIDLTPTEETGP